MPRHDIIGLTTHVEPKSPPDLVTYTRFNNVLLFKESKKQKHLFMGALLFFVPLLNLEPRSGWSS